MYFNIGIQYPQSPMLSRAKREPDPSDDHRRLRNIRSWSYWQIRQPVAIPERDAEDQDSGRSGSDTTILKYFFASNWKFILASPCISLNTWRHSLLCKRATVIPPKVVDNRYVYIQPSLTSSYVRLRLELRRLFNAMSKLQLRPPYPVSVLKRIVRLGLNAIRFM